VINLGFSGNGRMEPEVATYIAEINAAVFIIDCLPNIGAKEVTERTAKVVRLLRAKHPMTPILLVEDRNYTNNWLVPSKRQRNESSQAALKAEFAKLKAEGVEGLYYLDGKALLGEDGEDTVDTSHPTDLGFTRHADAFEKVLRTIPGLCPDLATDLPRILIFGDSISGGYTKPLIKLLEGKAEVVKLGGVATYRINNEAFWHSNGTAKNLDFGSAKACVADFERFEKHLSETPYDVIHFNFGLNDSFRGRGGKWHNPVDQYAKDLDKIVTLLKSNGARIIWSNTTPIPVNDPHRPEGDDLVYNAAAEKVMKANDIPINDLHSVVTRWDGYDEWRQGDDVHFGAAVYAMLADHIAEAVSAQLEP
jgi:lysophospholipase L1-like esterase